MIEVSTAAHVYGIPAPTIRRWIADGRLTKHGTEWRRLVDGVELADLKQRRDDRGDARRARRAA